MRHIKGVGLDGHTSRFSLKTCQEARKNGIILMISPANTTHIVQPLDVSIFSPLKTKISEEIQKLMREPNKRDFARVTKGPLESITKEIIKKSFKATGIFPSNVTIFESKSQSKNPLAKEFKNANEQTPLQLAKQKISRLEEENTKLKCENKVLKRKLEYQEDSKKKKRKLLSTVQSNSIITSSEAIQMLSQQEDLKKRKNEEKELKKREKEKSCRKKRRKGAKKKKEKGSKKRKQESYCSESEENFEESFEESTEEDEDDENGNVL